MAYRQGWRVSPVKGDLCPVRFMYNRDSVKTSGFEERRLVAMGGGGDAAPREDAKGKGKEVVREGEGEGAGEGDEEGMEGAEDAREPENKKVQKRWKFDTTKLLMGGPAMEKEETGEVAGGEDGMRVRASLPFITIRNFGDLEAILAFHQLPSSGESEDDIDIDLDYEGENECDSEMVSENENDEPTTNIELYSVTRLSSPTVSTNILSLPDNSLSAKYFAKLTAGKQPDPNGTFWVTPTLSSSDSKYRRGEWALPGRAKTTVVYEGYCIYDSTKPEMVPVNEVLECAWENGFDGAVRFEEIGEGEVLQERISDYPEDDEEEEGGLTEDGKEDVSMRDDCDRPAHELVGVSDDPDGCVIF